MNTFLPLVVGPTDGILQDTVVVSSQDLYQRQATFVPLDQDWQTVLGRFPRAPSLLAIHGEPGAGKTTFAIRFADHLARSATDLF